jgi:FMN phosphatase YigB (HAD superfamily)
MERHHAAERHLYPEVMDVLAQIKEEHPDVIIGAVTDGRANPMFMTFTLAPFFDFCMSWEDDQGARSKFFMELSSVEGNAELSWIYNAAYENYEQLRSAKDAIKAEAPQQQQAGGNQPDDERVWIHVGDDLAYDVGGSALCGAKTILVELADKYQQTARHRFDGKHPQPSWSTSPMEELEKRRLMNEAALPLVDQTIAFYGQLPEAINNILEKS